MQYPSQALVYRCIDYRYIYNDPVMELIGVNSSALCVKLRDINKQTIYHMMRAQLMPLTLNAKKFLDQCL